MRIWIVRFTAAPNNIGEGGIFCVFENNIDVSGNEVDNIIRTASPDSYGINLGFGVSSGIATITAGIVDGMGNATVTFNKIGAIVNSGTFAAAGIALTNTLAGTTQTISNNTISGLSSNGTASDFGVGIWLDGGTGTVNGPNSVLPPGVFPGGNPRVR